MASSAVRYPASPATREFIAALRREMVPHKVEIQGQVTPASKRRDTKQRKKQ